MPNEIDFAAIREAKGMGKAKFAAEADVSEPIVRRFEAGERDFMPRIISKLASAYGVPIDAIPTRPTSEVESITSSPLDPQSGASAGGATGTQ